MEMSEDMSRLLILGAGQYGYVAKEVAEAMGCFDTVSFLDDNKESAIGKLADYIRFSKEYTHAFVAIGNSALRSEWINRLQSAGFDMPVLVHPRAVIMPSAQVGIASVIEAMASVNSNAIVGEGCLISSGAVVNHDAEVGNCCHIDCNAVVPANERVPAQTKLFYGAVYHGEQEE